MASETTYREYVADREFERGYAEHQQRWRESVRESDRVLLRRIAALRAAAGRPLSLLDVGCSTGNLLFHLRDRHPEDELVGADLMAETVRANAADPALAGIRFDVADVCELPYEGEFDVVVANAVLFLFEDADLARAYASIARALRPGGTVLAFDFAHEFGQSLRIVERSATHPDGMPLHFRPFTEIRELLAGAGLVDAEYEPFAIPIDLPRPASDDDLISRTERAADGRRLLFRGALFQPWCHWSARRPA